MTRDKWIWMPHAGHFICGSDCRFTLNTYVGKYIVSTVGEYRPPIQLNKLFANAGLEMPIKRSPHPLNDAGFEEIGWQRFYETMVFKATKAKKEDGLCCPWKAASGRDLDMAPYNSAEDAFKGHMKMCGKWAIKETDTPA